METTEKELVWLKQPYPITKAQNNYNVREMRILLRITEALQEYMQYGKTKSQIQVNLLGDLTIGLNTRDLLPEGDQHYGAVKEALETLRKKSFSVKGKDETGTYKFVGGLILSHKYYYNNEKVEVVVAKELLPAYLALAYEYTRFRLDVAFNFSSSYAMKFYPALSHHRDRGALQLSLDELREWLQLGDKYAQSKDLRQYILEPVAVELKEKADVWFELGDAIKSGKRIVGWNLKVFQKEGGATPEQLEDYREKVVERMKCLLKMSASDIFELNAVLERPELYKRLGDKLEEIYKQVQAKRGKEGEIKHVAKYALAALKEEFKDVLGDTRQEEVTHARRRWHAVTGNS